MGTTNRAGAKPAKRAKKKVTKRPKPVAVQAPDTEGVNPLLLDDVDGLSKELAQLLDRIATQAETPVVDGLYPQRAMQACLALEKISKCIGGPISAACAALYQAALQHHNSGGDFEPGPVHVAFPTTGGGRSPKWKAEAATQAKRVAGLTHGIENTLTAVQCKKVKVVAEQHTFDEKAYGAAVLEATPRGKLTTGVRFEEGV